MRMREKGKVLPVLSAAAVASILAPAPPGPAAPFLVGLAVLLLVFVSKNKNQRLVCWVRVCGWVVWCALLRHGQTNGHTDMHACNLHTVIQCTHKNTHRHKHTNTHTHTHSLNHSHTYSHTPRGRLGPHGRHAMPELHAALLQTYTFTHTHKRMRTHIFSPNSTLHRLNNTMLTKKMLRKKSVDSMLLHGMHELGETEHTGPSFFNPSPAPPLALPQNFARHIPAAL